jgi:hypothetical protein
MRVWLFDAAGPGVHGAGVQGDEAAARAVAAGWLRDGRAVVAVVEEARISPEDSLVVGYQRLRAWRARRDGAGRIRWRQVRAA